MHRHSPYHKVGRVFLHKRCSFCVFRDLNLNLQQPPCSFSFYNESIRQAENFQLALLTKIGGAEGGRTKQLYICSYDI